MENLTNQRIKKLIEAVDNNKGVVPVHLVDSLFELHNSVCSPKEFNKGCGTCRKRTFKRLKNHYLYNIKK